MAEVIAFGIRIDGVNTAINSINQLDAAVQSTAASLRSTDIRNPQFQALQQRLGQLQAAQSSFRQEARRAAEASQFQEGSMRALNAQLGQLRTRYRDLSEADRNGVIGANLQRQIQQVNGELVRLDAGIGNYQRNVGNYKSAFEGLGGVFTSVLGGLGIGFGIKELGELALQSESYARKSATVLGDSLGYVTEQAEKNAAAIGLTSKQYIAATTDLADLLIPMGFGRKQAAEFSTGLVDLSGALSEWTGGQKDAKQVTEILQSAILGEREQLKGLGISISEADVKAQLAANGQDKLTGALLQQAEAQATYQLILAKSTDAQAAFANGAGSPIRALAQFKAQIFTAIELLSVGLLNGLELIISTLKGLANFLNENKVALLAAGVAVAAYAAALNGTKSALLLFEAAQAANTVVTNAAAIAQKGLSLAMAAVPYVAVGIAVYGLVKAMQAWFGATEEQIKTQEVLLQSQKELSDAYASEAQSAAELFAIAKSDVSSKEQKAKAVQRIIELYPDYLGGINTEADVLNNLDAVQKSVNKGILEGAIARIKAQKIQEATTALLDAQLKKEQAIFEANKQGIDLTSGLGARLIAQADADINDIKKRLADLPIFLAKVGESLLAQNIDFTGISVSDDQINEVRKQLQEVNNLRTAYRERYGKELEGEAKDRYNFLVNEEKRLLIERQKLIDSNLNSEKVAAQKSVDITKEAETKKTAAKTSKSGKTEVTVDVKVKGAKFTDDSIKENANNLADTYNEAFTEVEQGQSELDTRLKQLHDDFLAQQILDDKAAYEKTAQDEKAIKDKAAEEDKQRRQKLRDALIEQAFNVAQQIADVSFSIAFENARRESEMKLQALEVEKNAELALVSGNAALESQINARYEEEKKALQRKAFEEEKRLKIAQAFTNGALAITNAFATVPFPFSFIQAAGVAITTGLQIAQIKAAKFAKGGLIKGQGTDTSDNIPILASPNEFVVKASTVRKIGVNNLNLLNETATLPNIASSIPLPAGVTSSGSGFSDSQVNQLATKIGQAVLDGSYQGTNSGLAEGAKQVERDSRTKNKLGI